MPNESPHHHHHHHESSPPRFQRAQVHRSLIHPIALAPPPLYDGDDSNTACRTGPTPTTGPTPSIPLDGVTTTVTTVTTTTTTTTTAAASIGANEHCFVVAADPQLGMTAANQSWYIEVDYSRRAVAAINALSPRPLFCCVCGDLVDMTATMYANQDKPPLSLMDAPSSSPLSTTPPPTPSSATLSSASTTATPQWTTDECNQVQTQQFDDFQTVWSNLHPDIALVCLCGNHDVGNRPTTDTIRRYTKRFGDDYLAFWANGTYNICLNTSLFSDPTDARRPYEEQLHWLKEQLSYASRHRARHIFVYGHHPWFLYHDTEDATTDLTGQSPLPNQTAGVPDNYFPIPPPYRQVALDLFREYGVAAAFAGHFHQNVVSKASFGMEMIITGSLSMVLDSTGNPNTQDEPKSQGFRIVQVHHSTSGGPSTFHHRFVALPLE